MKSRIARLALATASVFSVGLVVAACEPPAGPPGMCIDGIEPGDGCYEVPENDRPANIPGNGPDRGGPNWDCTLVMYDGLGSREMHYAHASPAHRGQWCHDPHPNGPVMRP